MAADADQDERGRAVVVAVVSWNTRDLLDRCLRSLEPSANAGSAKVWVVDNGSTDGSPELVERDYPWARLVRSSENLGYGAAINLVAARTSSPWIAISNADIRLHPRALEELVAAGDSDGRVGAVAPRLVLPDGSTQHSVWPFPSLAVTIAQNLGHRLVPATVADRLPLPGGWNPARGRIVPWAVGAFLLVRRTAFDAVGGFDAAQWMSAEDLDLGWRLKEEGWLTRYEPRAVVDHDESAATGQVWGAGLRIHWQRCAYAWMVQKLGRRRTAAMGALNLVGALVRLLVYFTRAGFHADERVRSFWRWALVHLYAFAPSRSLERFR